MRQGTSCIRQGLPSFAAGLLVTDGGWELLKLLALPLVSLTALASLGLAVSRRRRRRRDAGERR